MYLLKSVKYDHETVFDVNNKFNFYSNIPYLRGYE